MAALDFHAPPLGPAGEPCPACAAPLAADQRYCLECGARRGPARLDPVAMARGGWTVVPPRRAPGGAAARRGSCPRRAPPAPPRSPCLRSASSPGAVAGPRADATLASATAPADRRRAGARRAGAGPAGRRRRDAEPDVGPRRPTDVPSTDAAVTSTAPAAPDPVAPATPPATETTPADTPAPARATAGAAR